MKKIYHGLAFRLTLLLVAGVSLILALVLGYNYFFSRKIIKRQIEENARETLQATINRIDIIFFSMEKATKALTIPMEDRRIATNREAIYFLLRKVVMENKEVYGSTISLEPYEFSPKQKFFAPYFYKSHDRLKFKNIPYNYLSWGWYMMPQLLNRPTWVEPYYDTAGEIVMSTYSVPLYKKVSGEKEFIGVATADVSLAWLQHMISSIRIGRSGYGFLISKMGTFVTHPNGRYIMRRTIFDVGKEKKDTALSALGLKMVRGETGYLPYTGPFVTQPCWIAFGPLRSNGWSLGLIFPRKELLADISRLNRRVMFISLAGFGLLLCVVILVTGGITHPLKALSDAAEKVAKGDWDASLPAVRHEDEVGRLTRAFEHMMNSLKQYFNDLKATTAAKEKIESELRIARDIQMGLIPKTFPPFPDRKEFDIYAILEPAREVGGDFYDFYFIDADHLCFVVGDVSGKGVPAALFMAVTKTLIKSDIHESLDPAAIVARVNQDLAQDNPNLMFVTLFLGILNTKTGQLAYCNGGHNPPYLIGPGGDLSPLPSDGGLALGIEGQFAYQSEKRVMQPNDCLVVYTDGVTEAMDLGGNFYGERRLENLLTRLAGFTVKETAEAVLDDIKQFAKDTPQSDDITLLTLKVSD